MITGSEMAVVDANAAALGVPRKQLMESSGNAIARATRQLASAGDSVTIVAGRGNNGGDGLVAARFLDEFDCRVLLLGRPETITTEIARENWEALERCDYDTETVRDSTAVDIDDTDIVVDAMLGTGISGSLREPEATAAAAINDSTATVLSVDVPSGLDAQSGSLADGAVSPDHVVTFHDTKPGLTALDAPVTIADIGIPDAAETHVERGDLLRLSRDPTSHKGDHGEILVVGGGPYAGAPALAGQAALRAGGDLVRIACPTAVAEEVQGYSENLILRPFEGRQLSQRHVDSVAELASDHDAIVVGPGLGDDDETVAAVAAVLERFEGTAVVDADALQVVPDVSTEATLICTPHQGELERMGGRTADDWRQRRDLVESFADELGHTLLVKGATDIVSDGERTRVSQTGNAGMTVGGTGDVLAGVAGAFVTGHRPVHAASMAAFVNGRAGDYAYEEYGTGLVATDLVGRIPKATGAE
jgi:NAD(P)H-hydrate epimerase